MRSAGVGAAALAAGAQAMMPVVAGAQGFDAPVSLPTTQAPALDPQMQAVID